MKKIISLLIALGAVGCFTTGALAVWVPSTLLQEAPPVRPARVENYPAQRVGAVADKLEQEEARFAIVIHQLEEDEKQLHEKLDNLKPEPGTAPSKKEK